MTFTNEVLSTEVRSSLVEQNTHATSACTRPGSNAIISCPYRAARYTYALLEAPRAYFLRRSILCATRKMGMKHRERWCALGLFSTFLWYPIQVFFFKQLPFTRHHYTETQRTQHATAVELDKGLSTTGKISKSSSRSPRRRHTSKVAWAIITYVTIAFRARWKRCRRCHNDKHFFYILLLRGLQQKLNFSKTY